MAQDVFSENPGKTRLIEHKIELSDEIPIRVKQYLTPHAMREAINDEVQEMLDLWITIY